VRLRVGYEGDFVWNRNLQLHKRELGKVLRETQLYTNAGTLYCSFCDLLEIFYSLGTASIAIYTPDISWAILTTVYPKLARNSTLLSDTHLFWSAGGRLILVEESCFILGIEGQYLRSKPYWSTYIANQSYYDDYLIGSISYFNDTAPAQYSEWQIGCGLAYTIHTLSPRFAVIPYIGCKYARAFIASNNFVFSNAHAHEFIISDLSSHKSVGYMVGATMTICDQISLSIEGRFGDERACYINGQICF
jgi:hypothetical protein